MLSEKEYNRLKGTLLLEELHLYAGHKMCVDVEQLGMAINANSQVLITLEVVEGKRAWVLKEATGENIKKARGHGYLVIGHHWQRLGGRIRTPMNLNPLTREEAEKKKEEAELAIKEIPSESSSCSSVAKINNARQKIEEEKEYLDKVNKGILPKAKIIYTPMGNKR